MIILLLALSVLFSACTHKPADGEYSFELYAHGDIHGCFFDSLYTKGAVRDASLANIAGYLNCRRDEAGGERVIAVDLGDHIHGDNSAYYYNFVHDYSPHEKHLFSKISQYVGYDAIVAGNHDIEAGGEIYNRIKDEMGIPYLAANVVDKATGKSHFQPYTIIVREGIRIAVVGLTTPQVKKWLGSEKIAGIDILPIQQLAEETVAHIREKEKPHLVFLAVHSGSGDGSAEDIEAPCRYLAATVDGIDGVLAAHDHIPYCGKEWNGTDSIVVVNSGPYGKNLSGVRIGLSIEDGVVSGKRIDASLIDMTSIQPDSAYCSTFREDYLNVREFSNRRLGSIDEDIRPGEIFDGPCLYSNLLHYVQLKGCDADVSFVSPTKFRGIVPPGEICYNDILLLYPFENILYKVSMTGAQILNYLELSYDNWKSKPVAFDCAGGISYTVDFTRQLGDRVKIHSFADGREFSPEETYMVAMASYRANGGGDLLLGATGLHMGQLEGIFVEKYGPVRDLLYDFFLNEKKTAASLAAVSDWNIVR